MKSRGMTLIELMVTIAITGVLSASAAASYSEQVRASRTVEAVSFLGVVKNSIHSYAGTEDYSKDLNFKTTSFGKPNGSDIDGDGNKGHGNNDSGCDPDNPNTNGCKGVVQLCPSAIPVPASIDSVRSSVYLSKPSEWQTEGWKCLRVSRSGNQHFQFGYDKTGGRKGEGFTIWARGDQDGDGRTSMFRLKGKVVGDQIVSAPGIEFIDRNE
jgi:prepilin-type N-terminal cleavage/methylation domain-containing protein